MYRSDISADDLQRRIRELHRKAEEAECVGRGSQASTAWGQMADAYRRLARLETNVLESARLNQKALICQQRAGVTRESSHLPIQRTSQIETIDSHDTAVASLLLKNSGVVWSDIGGMESAKQDLKYAMGLQLAQKPEELKRLDIPSRILLYGPPGGGKTLLAAAAANMLDAHFFNVKVSDLLSKYFGESTKLISALYVKARDLADEGIAVVFIDEVESLVADRDKSDFGPERRIISTLLSELDGLAQKNMRTSVITITATNRPWDIDAAILSRMDLRIFVDWPDLKAREAIFRIHLTERGHQLGKTLTCVELAQMTEGKTGRDIQRICKRVVLDMMASENRGIPSEVDQGGIRRYTLRCRPLSKEDFLRALSHESIPASYSAERKRFEDWQNHALEIRK